MDLEHYTMLERRMFAACPDFASAGGRGSTGASAKWGCSAIIWFCVLWVERIS